MIEIGTRSSRLARAQARQVAQGLEAEGHETRLVPTDSLGDRHRKAPVHELGVAGAFTSGLEAALARGEIDLAVHSLKDLPTETADGLEVAAVLERGPPGDVLLVRPHAHEPERSPPLAGGARVATSGPRRQSQLSAAREDLTVVNVRGNVDTRVAKLREGRFDALVTARVVLDRMDLDVEGLRVHALDPERFPPAPGQAAIAVQTRTGSPEGEVAACLDHEPSRRATEAERRLLARLGGGCGLPLGAWLRRREDSWALTGTFAGRSWDLTHEPHVRRVEATGPDPDGLVERVTDEVAAIDPRPRRPDLDAVPDPDGEPVLVLASAPTARAWAARLRRAGQAAEPIATSTVEANEVDEVPPAPLAEADWIAVTSRNAAAPLADALGEPLKADIAAVGPATARALQGEGLPCHVVGPKATGASLADTLDELAEPGATVSLAQGERTHGDLKAGLREADVDVRTWRAYRTREREPDPPTGPDTAPAVLATSPRNAEIVARQGLHEQAREVLAIGPSTAEALAELGIRARPLDRPTPSALLDVIE